MKIFALSESHLVRLTGVTVVVFGASIAVACADKPVDPNSRDRHGTHVGSGGSDGDGGTSGDAGSPGQGGEVNTGGGSSTGGNPSVGGSPATGGEPSTGGTSSGGTSTGGESSGGTSSGGTSSGGTSSGGTSSGGTSSGGTSSGGTSSGGTSSGGTSSGGTSSGGTSSGGTSSGGTSSGGTSSGGAMGTGGDLGMGGDPGTGGTSPVNLFPNGTFESNASGWFSWGGTVSQTTTRSHSGTGSGLLSGRASNGPMATDFFNPGSVNNIVTPGHSYTVTFWVTIGGATTANVNLTRKFGCYKTPGVPGDGSADSYSWLVNPKTVTEGNWVELTATLAVPDAATCDLSDVLVYAEGPPGGVDLYVDDVTVYEN